MGEAAGKGKERWPQVRLGDLITLLSGRDLTPDQYNDIDFGIPYITGATNIVDNSVLINRWTQNPVVISNLNDILLTCKGTVGEIAVNTIGPCHIARQFMAIRPDTKKIDKNYLKNLLTYNAPILVSKAKSMIPGITRDDVLSLKIPLPPLPEQRRIAAVLDQVSSLIALRKAQLAKLDLLVKARFVEMFGDPVKNEMGWNIVSLDEIAEISSGITKGRKTKEQDLKKVPYLSVSNVKDGYIDVSHVKTILATQNEIKQYKLLPYDVLMTEGGDPDKLGRGAILYQPPENCIHQNHIFRVRFDKNKINPVFFEEYLKHPAAKKYFLKCAKQTTGIATINMKQLSSLPVLLPPLEHQHVFSQFKQDTLKLKLAYNQTLEKLEILMKSLSLEYFG